MPKAAAGRFGWLKRHIPRRETVHENRLLRPFAHRLGKPELWRMHHRSLPRAVALGLGIGIIIPVMHMVIAAILAIPLRANVAVAAATTLLINPLTIPPMYYLAYRTGLWELRADAAVMNPSAAEQASGELARFLFWIHHASGPIAVGVLTLAIAGAAIGYAVTALMWRSWLAHKMWRRRSARRAKVIGPAA
jgi:uncharacterized protein (DUF2062 family)